MIAQTLQGIARALGGDVAGGQVLAPGPHHSPGDRSLSVKLVPDASGDFVVHSFAGDDPMVCRDHVRAALGKQPFIGAPRDSKVTATYIYKEAGGAPYHRVQRTYDKAFWQSHWDGRSWQRGKPKGPKLPYLLPALAAADDEPVFIVEGEKDADNLAQLGMVSTCNSEGAGKWTADLNPWFAGREVYVIPDNDPVGEDHAQSVVRHLSPVAASVRIVRLPGLGPKGDVSDWLKAGGDAAQLVDLCRAQSEPTEAVTRSQPRFGITAAELEHMQFPPIRWIIPNFLTEGCTILAGRPKLGKSWLALDWAVAVARGGVSLDQRCATGDVLYAALEDTQRRIKSPLEKVTTGGIWPERLNLLLDGDLARTADGGVERVREWLLRVEAPRLVIVDTLARVRDGKGRDEGTYEADYAAVTPWKALADEFAVAVVLVHHVRKMGAEDPLETISGTNGLTGAADAAIVLNRDGQGVTLNGRGRDLEEYERALSFDRETCRWSLLGDAAEVRRSDERTLILDALKSAATPMSPREIADVTDHSYDAVRRLLVKMSRAGEVEKVGRGAYQTPGHNGHKVTTDEPDEDEP